jgi:hypothetical protein
MPTTTPGDAWLVGQLAEASLPVFTNSALNTSDRERLGNDFAAFAPAGIVAAKFLTEGDVVRYHNAGDNVAAIDSGVVQDHGDTMVALARHFETWTSPRARTANQDMVFFTAPGLGLAGYPVWVAQTLALTATVALGMVVVAAWRRRRISGAHLTWATPLIPGMVLAGTTLAWGAWRALLAANPESAQTLPYPDFERSTTALIVIYAVIGLGSWPPATGSPAGSAAWNWSPEPWCGGSCWPCCSRSENHRSAQLRSGHWLVAFAGLAIIALRRRPWPSAAMLTLAAIPGLVLLVPLPVLETLNVEQGPLVAVPVLMLFPRRPASPAAADHRPAHPPAGRPASE